MQQLVLVVVSVLGLASAQRTPTISYVTPNISTTRSIESIDYNISTISTIYLPYLHYIYIHRSSTIDMDCSVLWATEYPILWMKIDSDGKPIPLASRSSLIIRDHR